MWHHTLNGATVSSNDNEIPYCVSVGWERVRVTLHISGTYNSQYMVVDLSRISLSKSIMDGALTVVEQIPEKVVHSDQTQALRRGKKPPICVCVTVSVVYFWVFEEVMCLDDLHLQCAPLNRLLAVIQYTVSCWNLQPEWLQCDVGEIWRRLLLWSLSPS